MREGRRGALAYGDDAQCRWRSGCVVNVTTLTLEVLRQEFQGLDKLHSAPEISAVRLLYYLGPWSVHGAGGAPRQAQEEISRAQLLAAPAPIPVDSMWDTSCRQYVGYLFLQGLPRGAAGAMDASGASARVSARASSCLTAQGYACVPRGAYHRGTLIYLYRVADSAHILPEAGPNSNGCREESWREAGGPWHPALTP